MILLSTRGGGEKDLKRLIKALEDQGFEVVIPKKGNQHPRVFLNGQWVTNLATTPSDWRGFRNAIAAARRFGFRWPP
jgi:DUF1009 family protein